MMKKTIALLLILTFLIPFAGCGRVGWQESLGDDPITVTDQAGRTVVIETKPQRLISCYYITTSLLMALGLGDNIVGIENEPHLRPIYGRSAPHLLQLPWVGTAKTLDLEACAALQPDLVILPLRLKDSAEILEDLGIDVLLVNPESQELLVEMIRLVGAATRTQETANALIAFLDEVETDLTQTLAGVDAPRVYLAGNSSLLSTAGDAMYQSDMIRLAGGNNVAGEIVDPYWAQIDYEQLLAWNPDYIILASSAQYTVADVLADPNLADCAAVKNGNVYQIPSDAESWDSPVPSSILGAMWLANILHPQRLTDADCAAVMDTYYETFYHFTYTKK